MASHSVSKLKLTTIDLVGGIFCKFCNSVLSNKQIFDLHYQEQHVNKDTVCSTIIYTCVVCRAEFDSYSRFRDHCYNKHVNKDRLKCEECDKLFSTAAALQIHVNGIHNFVCPPPCNKKFKSKKELNLHKVIHSYVKPPCCYQCQETLNTHDTFVQHIDLHTTYTYPCPICSHDSANKPDAIQHLKIHFTDEKETEITVETRKSLPEDSTIDLVGITCHICNDLFSSKVEFECHFQSQHENSELTYSCTICDKQYTVYPKFAHHCYEHSVKGRFQCDICFVSFSRLVLLVQHSNMNHPVGADDESLLQSTRCPECGKKFPNLYKTRTHLRECHDIDGYKCKYPECQKIFESSKELLDHQCSHSYNDNWCRQCSFMFTSINTCVNHLEIHKKINYSCPVCRKVYAEKHLILKHATEHFEATLNICKICGMSYKKRYRLSQHAKIHNKISKFSCPQCGKGFLKKDVLDDHMNVHLGKKPYQCPACPRTFANYPNLYKHSTKIHKLQPKKKSDFHEEFFKEAVKPTAMATKEGSGGSFTGNIVDNEMQESDINSNFAEVILEKTALVELKPEDLKQLENIDLPDDFVKQTTPDEDFVYSIVTDNNQDYIDLNALPRESNIFEESSLVPNDVEFAVQSNNLITNFPAVPVSRFEEIPPTPEPWRMGDIPKENKADIPEEYIADIPEEYVADIPKEYAANIPPEYGPDFNSYIVAGMDEHAALPHIDPKNIYIDQPMYSTYQTKQNHIENNQPTPETYQTNQNHVENDEFASKYVWEPPIFTKLYQESSYSDISDVTGGILPIIMQDILY